MSKRKSAPKKENLLAVYVCFALGCALIFLAVALKVYANRATLAFDRVPQTNNFYKGKKTISRLAISRLSIDLPVSEATVTDNQWYVSDTGLSHLKTSANPGDTTGNIVVYGHNKKELLGKLPQVREGDRIRIITTDGTVFIYTVQKTRIVSPREVSILEKTPEETLTIYTCTGFADTKRFVVTASLATSSIVSTE